MDENTQLLHTIIAKLEILDTRMCAVEAQGERHSFVQPKAKAKAVKAVKATKVAKKAKVVSPERQDYRNFKTLAKASGWTQEFYLAFEAYKVTHNLPKKLQGEDYCIAYNKAFRAKYVA